MGTKGTKGLELWCKMMTEGYPNVNVTNMTTSWRDGLAFCAIIHHFRPDLIEFDKLNKDDIYYNNELAFRTAERHLGIPALLEPEDMVEFPVPDRLSILTYLSQFYQTFGVTQGKSPSRIAPKRPAASPDSPPSTSPPTKLAVGKIRREPCAKCGHPVFIAERLNVGKLLYHRTCFRCARCSSQLTLANYYETENGEFCCETCPDEEKSQVVEDTSSVLTRSLSDEEKSASLKTTLPQDDDYSAKFETALEDPEDDSLKRSSTLKFSQARSFFVSSQVDASESEDEPPDLPQTKPPSFGDGSGFPRLENNVQTSVKSVDVEDKSQDVVTKDTISAEGNTSSLVKARMRLFETKADATNENVVNDYVKVPSKNSSDESNLHSFKNVVIMETSFCSLSPVLKDDDDSVINISDNSVITISDASEDKVITISDDSLKKEVEEESKIIDEEVEDTSKTVDEEVEEKPKTVDEEVEDKPKTGDEEIQEKSKTVGKVELSEIEEPKDSSKAEEEYPDDLNPFGDVEEDKEKKPANVSLNPFEDDDDDDIPPAPSPKPRKKIQPSSADRDLSTVYIQRISVNPFEEEEEKPQAAKRKVIAPPQITLNPFWSDDEDDRPVPKPRTSKSSGVSNSSSNSATKKKKPAPKPPSGSGPSSLTSSPCHSVTHSPRGTPKFRKNRKAPPPPISSTPMEGSAAKFVLGEEFEKEKSAKDEVNRNRQSQNLSLQSPSSSENSSSLSAPNKSTYGKWKRRKGQAPARPIPQRRVIKGLPMVEVKRELEIIEIQQQGLEKQGVRLEQIIRERCEGPGVNPDESLPPEIEDMVLQLFELVNEKNELFRRQAELMYLRRQNKLEEEHAEVEYQIRCLMLQPEANKTDSDKAKEEELINRLVEIVERRNEIIECLEMDRVREAEEDDSINNQLNLYTAKKEDKPTERKSVEKKEKKKHKKEKRFIKLKSHKVDADKDIDESESSTSLVKDKKKKKFNIF